MEMKEIKAVLTEKVMSPMELVKSAYQVINERFGSFLLLTLLVYVPVKFVMQYKMLQVPTDLSDTALLLTQAADVLLVQLVMMFVEIIAILVGAVMVQNMLLGDGKLSFGSALYQGVKRWIFGVYTLLLVLMAVWFCLLPLLMMPGMIMLVMPFAVVLGVYFGMLQSMVCSGAALRKYAGLKNLRYTFFLLKGKMWPAFKAFGVVFIISGAVSVVCDLLLSNMLSGIGQDWLFLLVSTAFGALLSILAVFNFVAGSILFINLEELRRKEIEELKKQYEERAQREVR